MESRLRNKVYSEWRGLPEKSVPPERGKAIVDAMEEVMARLGLQDRLHQAQILGVWKELVGDFLASHSSPSRLRDGVLYVQVLQPSVHFELDRHWKRQVLTLLKERFGSKMVRDVRFSVGG